MTKAYILLYYKL